MTMRHSATHLVVAFCTGMAVSAAPLSPLPPVTPAALSPLPPVSPAALSPLPGQFSHSVVPRGESHEVENACHDSDIQNDHCVGGFSYHVSDSEGIKKRDTTTDGINDSGREQSEAEIQSAEDFDLDIDPGEDSDIERRWSTSIYNRSPTPYPHHVKEDDNQDLSGPENDDDYASVASSLDFSDNEDDVSSIASDDVFSVASEKVNSGPETRPSDVLDKEKAEKRSVEIDGQSERHGGRTYLTGTVWRV